MVWSPRDRAFAVVGGSFGLALLSGILLGAAQEDFQLSNAYAESEGWYQAKSEASCTSYEKALVLGDYDAAKKHLHDAEGYKQIGSVPAEYKLWHGLYGALKAVGGFTAFGFASYVPLQVLMLRPRRS